jgi:RNA polymerase sigma-70 factor (ECF subfamily)
MTGRQGAPQTNTVPDRAPLPQQGDRFEALYRAQAGYVMHSLRRLGVEERDVEDVAHDTFVIVGRKLADYDVARPVRPWLFGIVFRVALDYRRSARVQKERLDPLHEAQEVVDGRPPADAHVERADAQRLVLAALETLRLEARAVLILHDIDEVPVPEVATALGIPLNTAYSRLRLARAQFEAAVRELSRGEG